MGAASHSPPTGLSPLRWPYRPRQCVRRSREGTNSRGRGTQCAVRHLVRPRIPNPLQDFVSRLARPRLRRVVMKALALTPRAFVPRDVLLLTGLSGQLQVEWQTRDVPPLDRILPAERQAMLFREQTLHDTDTALVRLFHMLPEITSIDVRVLGPHSPNRLLLAGTVGREDVMAARSLSSPGMRLKIMGVQYHVRDGHLAP